VLCAAGLAKLRSPTGALDALTALGLPARAGLVRAVAVVELVLGAWSFLAPTRPTAAAVATMYAVFAMLSFALTSRHAACGCFGGDDAPAWVGQSLLSVALSAVGVAAAVVTPHGIGWILGSGVGEAATLLLAIGASAYATIVVYTQLPRAWTAWSAR
jgi:uncharacterized membrane protein YphA (DoxX/SURF4 family)